MQNQDKRTPHAVMFLMVWRAAHLKGVTQKTDEKTNLMERALQAEGNWFQCSTAWNCWRLWGYRISVNPSHPVEFLSSFHLPHLFMFETRGRKTNLWILFHPCTWFPSENACCRRTGAMFIFIFIYWNELHFASVKGNSLNTTSVHAFIFTYSQTPLENKGCFLV